MFRLFNFIRLAIVGLPFLKHYWKYQLQKNGRGGLVQIWKTINRDVPDLAQLDQPLKRRIQHYLFANMLTTQWFGTLHYLTISEPEKMTGYYIATATPIADYLVDLEKRTLTEIYEMMDGNSKHPWTSICQQLYIMAAKHHPCEKTYRSLIIKTLEAQENSLLQKKQEISKEQLKDITWNKGGYALLLYRSALHTPIDKIEESAIFQLGGLMQLHNDIFDLWRDLQEGIKTIPSTVTSVSELDQLFTEEINKTIALFNKIKCKKSSKHQFYLLLSLAIQTGYICLDQYKSLEKKYGAFNSATLSRKEQVCDMDDPIKIIKTVIGTLNTHFKM